MYKFKPKNINSSYEELLPEYIKYITMIAMSYKKPLYTNDLISYGKIGLWEAHKRYDESKGIKFHAYACTLIKWEMMEFLTSLSRTVRLPRKKVLAIKHKKYEDLSIISTDLVINYDLTIPITFGDQLSDEEKVMFETKFLYQCINQLKDEYKDIVIEHYFKDKSLREISREGTTTVQNYSQKLKVALKKLRKIMDKNKLIYEDFVK